MREWNNDNLEREIAEGEQWLRQFETPAPSAEAVSRLKAVLTGELGQRGMGGRAAPMRQFLAWQGALVAAAAIVLAIGISWYSWQRQGAEATVVADLGESFPLSADAREQLNRYSDWESELSALESEQFEDALYDARETAMEMGSAAAGRVSG